MSVRPAHKTTWGRDRVPLVTSVLSAVALLSLFPSALNIPQSTPSETLEYAPVPPEDQDDITPPSGNFSSLGLGSSSAIGREAPGEGEAGGGAGEAPGGRALKSPTTKRCVGDPPRQTEDPLSPPCVASYSGDNGGATYQGVTRDEVRVVFAIIGGRVCDGCSDNPPEQQPTNKYYDLSEPPEGDPMDEHLYVRELRAWQRYFNNRYQTYGRFVNFFVHYGPGGSGTPEAARAQAAENYQKVKPFAAMAGFGVNTQAYAEVMATKGVVMFSDFSIMPSKTFATYPGLLWNYSASLELRVEQYVSHVCTKVVPHPVSDSGNLGENGQPRQLGLIYSEDDDAAYIRFRTLVRQGIERCGGKFVTEGTYPRNVFISTDPSYAPPVMADFQEKGVTTVIWAGGFEPNFSRAAKAIGYFPEWVIASTESGQAGGNLNGQSQDQDVWDHAWIVTDLPLVDQTGVTQSCAHAYTEAGGRDDPLERNNSCGSFYDILRQMFTGIQVSGPKLNVQNLDKGYHAIPPKDSPRPDLPACFYGPGDYTCVKDMTVMWWDSQGQSSTGAGCWRMSENGARYRAGSWPAGNLDAQRQPDNVCNNILGGG